MFVLVQLEDTIRVDPSKLGTNFSLAVANSIRATFLDKVVDDLGLAITLSAINKMSGGIIPIGDGGPHYKVVFSLVMFRPLKDEVIIGTLSSCDHGGLKISVGFFSDIIVPVENLQQPAEWDEKEELWVWQYEDEALFLDLGEEIRVKVVDVHFPVYKNTNTIKVQDKRERLQLLESEQVDEPTPHVDNEIDRPMIIEATINGDGLGLSQWWG